MAGANLEYLLFRKRLVQSSGSRRLAFFVLYMKRKALAFIAPSLDNIEILQHEICVQIAAFARVHGLAPILDDLDGSQGAIL